MARPRKRKPQIRWWKMKKQEENDGYTLAVMQKTLSVVDLRQHYSLETTLQPQGKEPEQRDTPKNHGRLGGIRQTPGYRQKQPCHLPDETGVQLL